MVHRAKGCFCETNPNPAGDRSRQSQSKLNQIKPQWYHEPVLREFSDTQEGPRPIIRYTDPARQHNRQSSWMETRSPGFIGGGWKY
jgi:hypothetical protein